MRFAALLLVALLLAGADCGEDIPPWECSGEVRVPGACEPGTTSYEENLTGNHVSEPTEIEYPSSPPSSGNHRPGWGMWGEHGYLPRENWLHNLEHGGVVLLYHPCAEAETVDALREFARARPDDDSAGGDDDNSAGGDDDDSAGGDDEGAFRWILTPYPDLPTTLAVVAWEWKYEAECFDEAEITEFIDAHYRQAPEDVDNQGSVGSLFIGL